MKKLALAIIATSTVASCNGEASSPLSSGLEFHFQIIKQTIECVRQPGTDYLVCSPKNETSDNEEPDTGNATEIESYFSDPVDIIIPEYYWPLISEQIDGPHITFIDPIDFDNDGLMDLALTSDVGRGRNWGTDGPGTLYRGNGELTADDLDGESWTSEIFLRQTEPGVYEIWNYELFGEDFIYLGGMGRKRIVADVNKDGFPDLVRALNREDGRKNTELHNEDEPFLNNWMTQQKAFISNGNGTYRIDDLGDLVMWGHAITTAKMENGDQDIVFGSYDNKNIRNPWKGPANAFTYQGDYQEEYGDYPWLDAWDIMASDPVNIGDKNYSEYLIDTREFLDEQGEPKSQGYAIFKQVDGLWEPYLEFPMSTIVDSIDVYMDDKNLLEGQNNIKTRPVWEHQGVRLVNHTWADSCSLMLYENEAIFVSVADGIVIPENFDYSQPIYPNDLEGNSYNKFITAWKIENDEVIVLDHIFNEQWENPQGERFFECRDINGDGLDDYMSWSSGYADSHYPGDSPDLYPQVYINNGKGDLVHHEIKGLEEIQLLPHNPDAQVSTGVISQYMDINGDGIGDFLHHIYGQGTLRIQYGIKPQ